MSDEIPALHSKQILRITLVFVCTVLALTYCSLRIFRTPLKTTMELSPQLKKRLSFDIEEANPDTPGERTDLKDITQTGKLTIVEFYSLFSPDCRELEPKLEMLSRARPDLAVRRLNIDRPDKERRSIDFDSPLAKQYNIRSLPEFKLFNPDEKLIAEGALARREVDLSIVRDVKSSGK